MNFTDYYKLATPKEKVELAKNLDCSIQYLSHLATGYRKAGLKYLNLIPAATGGLVTMAEIRPDKFGRV